VSQHQQWQILAQGADVEVYGGAPYNGTNGSNGSVLMNNLGDGYFQIVNQNQAAGINVLDGGDNAAPNSAVVQNPQTVAPTAITGSNANQEWDIMTVGNCGDIPANCTNPPLTALGDYYMIVNKNSGLVLTVSGSSIQQQTPAAPSNTDWMVPANKGQLWQLVPVHISAPSTPAILAFAPTPPASVPVGGNLGMIDVNVLNTATALIGSPSEPVTLTVTGPAEFSQTATSSAGVAGIDLSGMSLNLPGTYSISASSPGLTSATASVTVVGMTPTTTGLTSSANPSTSGQSVTFTATVAGVDINTPLPTGSVTFLSGSTSLGTGTLSGAQATFSISTLAAGADPITAQYTGDMNYAGSTSAVLTQTVSVPPSYTVAFSSPSLTLNSGQSGSVTLTITPVGGFNQAIAFSCAGLPQFSTCTFNPATVTPNGSTPASATLTIATNVKSSSVATNDRRNNGRPRTGRIWYAGLIMGLGFLFTLRNRHGLAARRVVLLSFMLLALTATLQLTGCSGSGTSTSTPTGSSTITVTTTAGTQTQTASFTLVVVNIVQ